MEICLPTKHSPKLFIRNNSSSAYNCTSRCEGFYYATSILQMRRLSLKD